MWPVRCCACDITQQQTYWYSKIPARSWPSPAACVSCSYPFCYPLCQKAFGFDRFYSRGVRLIGMKSGEKICCSDKRDTRKPMKVLNVVADQFIQATCRYSQTLHTQATHSYCDYYQIFIIYLIDVFSKMKYFD